MGQGTHRGNVPSYISLHNHTGEGSLLDGLIRVKELPARAHELGMDAVALTDHGTLYGAVAFYKACQKHHVRPILGCEVYVAPRGRTDREAKVDAHPYHLVLLAENQGGYRNLLHLLSLASLEGFYYKPRVDRELLAKYHEGLIALSGCLAGEVPRRILEGRIEDAYQAAADHREIFGPENYFFEVMDHGMPEELQVRARLVEMGRELGIPLVATNDAHYLRREDAKAHDLLLSIQTGKLLSDPDRLRFPNDEFYLKSPAEMAERCTDLPAAMANTVAIADRCHVELTFDHFYLPSLPLPEGQTPGGELRRLAEEGLTRRFSDPGPGVRERLDYELAMIEKMGFNDYFLIVRDFVAYSQDHGIAVGPGRGSAAGSLVSYVLGITDLDPLRYGLLFERFLNPSRVTLPDVDIDFAYERRGEVIEYVTKTYGADHVSQIITFGTLGARAAIRDVGRALEYPLAEVDRLAKQVPTEVGITLEKALEGDLGTAYRADSRVRQLIDLARSIEGLPRHASVHAAGVVITPEPLMNLVPLQRMTDGTVVTQFSMGDIEALGLVKYDFLGLRTLTVLTESVRLVRDTRGEEVDISHLPMDDPETFRLLGEANTLGVFQLESRGMREMLREMKPSCLEDITAAVSLYRPGPMELIPDFIARKHGGTVTYPHPALEPVLRETYGIMVYQEQIMQVASTMAGFSLGESDLLRRAVGKKKKELLERERDHFIEGCLKQGHERALAEGLYDLILRFANYGFNKSHGAAYAYLAYQTAYLRAHYRTEFLAATLTSFIGDQDKIAFYVTESRRQGAVVLPPDINRSEGVFAVESDAVRFGLLGIRNLGATAVEDILHVRREGVFRSFSDLRRRTNSTIVNKRALEALVQSGACDGVGERASLWEEISNGGPKAQVSLFDLDEEVAPSAPAWTMAERLSREKEGLGFYLSGHPLDRYRDLLPAWRATGWDQIEDMADGAEVRVVGMITSLRQIKTRRGEQMVAFRLEDDAGAVEVVVFPRLFAEVRTKVQPDALVMIRGHLKRRDNGLPQVNADGVDTLADWEPLWLHATEEARAAITKLALRSPGPTPIYVNTGQSWRAHRSRIAVTDEVLAEFERLLGPENVSREVRPPAPKGAASA